MDQAERIWSAITDAWDAELEDWDLGGSTAYNQAGTIARRVIAEHLPVPSQPG